jgi:hypothetical protein
VDRRVVPLTLLIAAACTGTAAPHPTASSVAPRPSVAPINPLPARDVSVWVAPSPDTADLMGLFAAGAEWAVAANHIRVFELPEAWVLGASDQELSQVISGLSSRGIQVAVTVAALIETNGCRTEGFAAPGTAERVVRRIQDVGGTVGFVALDQPFAAGHLALGCGWSKRKVAGQVEDVVAALRKVAPDIQVGDIEPLTAWSIAGDLTRWLPTATTAGLSFFHLLPSVGRSDWTAGAKQVEEACRAHGLSFGVIYAGAIGTDQAVAAYEVKAGGVPAQVVFQSSQDAPSRLLPETDPGTLTWLVDRYFRTRSHLDIEIGPSQFVGSDRVNGILSDASGARIPGATVAITMAPVNADGSLGFVYDIGTRSTDAEGAFQLTFRPPGVNLHFGKVLISAWFAGDDRYWPAYRSGTTSV